MSSLLHIDAFDQFARVKDFPASKVPQSAIATVRTLDERTELEPAFLQALSDPNETPHGPAELADILTHRVTVGGRTGLAAFILKGKSFPTVRPKDVSHQIFRLRKISGLSFVVLAATGTILDPAKDEFISTAEDQGCDYAIFDANDIARLLVVLGLVCPRDGNRLPAGRCQCGYRPTPPGLNLLQEEALRGLQEAHALGQAAGLVVMPTGSGKTRVAVQDVIATGAQRVLFVAHTDEILDVAEDEFSSALGSKSLKRVESADDFTEPAQVRLATVQLLSRHITEVAAAELSRSAG